MSSLRFEYDESLFSSCASSRLASYVYDSSVDRDLETSDRGDEACRMLLEQHASHYRRELSTDDVSIAYDGMGYHLSRRMQRFVSNVVLVHRHNRNLQKDSSSTRHHVGLNQFADLEEHELPLSDTNDMAVFDSIWNGDIDEAVEDIFEGVSASFVRLEDEGSILGAAREMDLVWSRKRHKGKKKRHRHDKTIVVPTANENTYPTLKVAEDLDIGDYSKYTQNTAEVNSTEHNFETYMNWATTSNPDGVGIVHPVMDQGKCGSCWAFAATGTLEASASRRAAFQAFRAMLQQPLAEDNDDLHERALLFAQKTEQVTLAAANLSVQELVDCDTAVDQGCTGGNPLLAFYFIHRFGLTSWANYPYTGGQGKCRGRRVAEPIATVQSWGILTPNHEDNMELVLRYIGPIAVGINGADPTFLAYTGGIFDSENCSQAANHALLIVGVGTETNEDGSVVKFWICRNTWGVSWGEGGYVRVKRGEGKKGLPGVCGLAKNPSVALGGTLLEATDYKTSLRLDEYTRRGRSPQLENPLYDACDTRGLRDFSQYSLGFQLQCMVEYHRALVLGCASIVTVMSLVVWPLTSQCRSRRRRRRSRRRRKSHRTEESRIMTCEESAPLVEGVPQTVSYGADVQTVPPSPLSNP